MGKTKTAFIGVVKEGKSSEQAYREKKEKQKAEEKIHISGLKGGQRVKVISAEVPASDENAIPEVTSKKEKAAEPKERGKKYQSSKTKIALGKIYKLSDAIPLVKDVSYSKFVGTMEAHIVVKKTGTSAQVTLPYSGGRAKKIEVASELTIKKLQSGKIDFDILLATADMMPKLVAFARILGPKGLMPNPKNGTLIKSVKDADRFSSNTLNLKTEKEAPLIHTSFGKVDQKDEELILNLETIINALGGNKQIVRVFIKSTMSPSIKVET